MYLTKLAEMLPVTFFDSNALIGRMPLGVEMYLSVIRRLIVAGLNPVWISKFRLVQRVKVTLLFKKVLFLHVDDDGENLLQI